MVKDNICGLRPLQVKHHHVLIWCRRTEHADVAAFHTRFATLSPEERAQCGRLHFQDDRCDYVNAHDLLRTFLSRLEPITPSQWHFDKDSYGKPFLRRNPQDHPSGMAVSDLNFNLSHTKGLVACAVRRGTCVGIDVECADRLQDAVQIAEHFFSPQEVSTLRHCADAATRAVHFIELWTLKEAFLKAVGVGLTQPLNTMTFDLSSDGHINFWPPAGFNQLAWHFALFAPLPGARVAVATHDAASPRFVCEFFDQCGSATLRAQRRTS